MECFQLISIHLHTLFLVFNMPSGEPYDNWFPIGANHGITVVGYEKNRGQNLDYAKGIYFVRKLDKWYPVYF